VILLLPKGAASWQEGIGPGDAVTLGQVIGSPQA